MILNFLEKKREYRIVLTKKTISKHKKNYLTDEVQKKIKEKNLIIDIINLNI